MFLTNKLPEVERAGVPHLLMDFKQPGEQYGRRRMGAGYDKTGSYDCMTSLEI